MKFSVFVLFAVLAGAVLGDILKTGSCGEKCTYTVHSNGTLVFVGEKMKQYEGASDIPWKAYKTQITDIYAKPGFKEIEQYACYGCSQLTSVRLPSSLTKLGNYAFQQCASLKSVTLPSQVEKIKEGVFYGCESLESVTITSRIKMIEDEAFFSCTHLVNISIPSSVEYVGERAFEGCSSLTNVTIPDGTLEIWERAFKDCTSLTTVVLGGSVGMVADSAFEGCTALKDILYFGVANPALSKDDPFKGCDAIEHVCVPREYNGDAFCKHSVYPKSDAPELAYLNASNNHCYGVLICNETYGIALERANVSAWARRRHSCFNFYCDNETGPSVYAKCAVNSSGNFACVPDSYFTGDDVCSNNDDNVAVKGSYWIVVVDFENMTDASHYNKTDVIRDIRSISGLSSSSTLRLGSEIDEQNFLQHIYIFVEGEKNAKTVQANLESTFESSPCEYGIICHGKETYLIPAEVVSGAYRAFGSLFFLLLAMMAAFIF